MKLIEYSVNMDLASFVLLPLLSMVSAATYDEQKTMRVSAMSMLSSCEAEHGVTKIQILNAMESRNPDALEPCFYACFFKKSGVMNEEGLFDPITAVEKSKEFTSDKEYLEKILKIGINCSSVNNESVEDGAKGCQRARLLIHCVLE